jgi:hypothetical protein
MSPSDVAFGCAARNRLGLAKVMGSPRKGDETPLTVTCMHPALRDSHGDEVAADSAKQMQPDHQL